MERFEEVFKAAIQGMHQENVKAYGSNLANVLLPALEALQPVFKATYDQGVKDEQEKLEGCVVVPKDQTEDWYLDPDEHIWWEADGIDGTLCDMNIGEVTAIEHKEYLITVSDTLYAAIVWDDENEDSGTWEFFKTEEEAEKAAAHCKAMVEAARGGNEH